MFLLPILNDSFINQIYNNYMMPCLDSNYCIISLDRGRIRLSIFIFSSKDRSQDCQINFFANSSNLLFFLISQHKSIFKYISLSHVLYIGKELYKAELSKMFQQKYVQL